MGIVYLIEQTFSASFVFSISFIFLTPFRAI